MRTRGESALNQSVHGLNVGSTWKGGRHVTNNAYAGIKITDPSVHPYAPDSLKARFDELDVGVTQTRSLNYSIYIEQAGRSVPAHARAPTRSAPSSWRGG